MLIPVLLILPFALCIIMFLLKRIAVNTIFSAAYSVFFLAAAVLLNIYKSEFTRYFRVDSLNAVFLIILGILNFGVTLYNMDFLRNKNLSGRDHTFYSIFYMLFILCMSGVIMSMHIGLLWVFVEATTLTSAYLIYFNKDKSSLEAAWKYIFICSIGIAIAFVGIILLSIATISAENLFFDNLYKNSDSIIPFWLKLSFVFILVGFGTKMGLAPVHAWLPDAHSEAPSPVSAMLSGTLLNAAFIGILRIYKVMELTGLKDFANILLLIMGFLSLVISATFLFKVNNYKRMFAYSSIENMGIIAIGIGIGGGALYASLLHLISHSLAKGSLFLTAGNILSRYKTKKIDHISGVIKTDPVTGWLMIFSFVIIIGMPPSPIFISEFLMIREMMKNGSIIMMIAFVLMLTVIIFAMGNSIFRMIFGKRMEMPDTSKLSVLSYVPQIIFIAILIALGLYIPGIITDMINNALSML